ncbi:UNVERIFIED_ORG: hypothetical protein GGI57_006468 [Rhizobium aethiopicum]|uniref:Uncharacterized protein n=2 Tax=Rhizobium TaxID=379 RepID=A0A7X0DWR2_RHILE|nr:MULTISPECIES: hypothetical protein [Rhizobium]EGE56322.1 hypothetical protein RHECNPAF_715007 [Rhizobium etli CNPAF512]MBB4332457.1 hypothetical protein [Rhizobium leguminosarum]MBB4357442.1 hypothetical protein [Rhizobium leguminosarum]MBB4510233.1 hypothetical protein [Rhizobium leguminosarum]MBB4552097.1 hypothetical protein [Rhizobium leguminosarum]
MFHVIAIVTQIWPPIGRVMAQCHGGCHPRSTAEMNSKTLDPELIVEE